MIKKPKNKDKHFGLRLPHDLFLKLKKIAKINSVSVGQVIRVLVERGVSKEIENENI